jgi:hypothetical protein
VIIDMFDALTRPSYPNAALGITDPVIAAVSIRRAGRGMVSLERVGILEMPAGVIEPSFADVNIIDGLGFSSILREVSEAAGLLGQKRWSVSLPSNAARTAIVSLEAEPASRQETEEILDWKAEQTFGVPAAELRVSRQKIAPDASGKTRYFMSAVKLAVIDEYESHFESLGWKAGLILPRSLGEANWLLRGRAATDSLLISVSNDGFTALLLRGSEPMLVRSVTCRPEEIDDEVYRLLMFYGDRVGGTPDAGLLERVLVVGDDGLRKRLPSIAAEALGASLRVLGNAEAGMEFLPDGVTFDSIAAPAGLAALAA